MPEFPALTQSRLQRVDSNGILAIKWLDKRELTMLSTGDEGVTVIYRG